MNTSTADTAHEVIQLAAESLLDSLPTLDNRTLVMIHSTDATVTRDCLKSGTHDHRVHIKTLSTSISNILDTYPDLQINISWLPAAKGSKPLQRLKALAAEAAHLAPPLPPPLL